MDIISDDLTRFIVNFLLGQRHLVFWPYNLSRPNDKLAIAMMDQQKLAMLRGVSKHFNTLFAPRAFNEDIDADLLIHFAKRINGIKTFFKEIRRLHYDDVHGRNVGAAWSPKVTELLQWSYNLQTNYTGELGSAEKLAAMSETKYQAKFDDYARVLTMRNKQLAVAETYRLAILERFNGFLTLEMYEIIAQASTVHGNLAIADIYRIKTEEVDAINSAGTKQNHNATYNFMLGVLVVMFAHHPNIHSRQFHPKLKDMVLNNSALVTTHMDNYKALADLITDIKNKMEQIYCFDIPITHFDETIIETIETFKAARAYMCSKVFRLEARKVTCSAQELQLLPAIVDHEEVQFTDGFEQAIEYCKQPSTEKRLVQATLKLCKTNQVMEDSEPAFLRNAKRRCCK